MEEKELYKELLLLNSSAQMIVAIEELSELQKELTKALRNKIDRVAILEEYVDVTIMLEQIKILYELNDKDINLMKKMKLDRLQTRLENNNL